MSKFNSGSRVDIEELPSPAGQQQAHHSQTPHQDAVSPVVKRWQQGEKRPRGASLVETVNRASGKIGTGLGGCSRIMKTGGCGISDSTIRVHGSLFGQWSSQSFLQCQVSSVVPLVCPTHVDSSQDPAPTVSSSLVASRFKGPTLSADHRPLNLVDSRHVFPPQYHKKRSSGHTAIDIAGNPDQIQGAIQSLVKDFYAEGTWRTRAAHWKTVMAMLCAAGFFSITSLSTIKVIAVAAFFKQAGKV